MSLSINNLFAIYLLDCKECLFFISCHPLLVTCLYGRQNRESREEVRGRTACSWQIWVRRSRCSSLTALDFSYCWISRSISIFTCST